MAGEPEARRVRCSEHGLWFDPRRSQGCARCQAPNAAANVSWLRIALVTLALLGLAAWSWQHTSLAERARDWARGRSVATRAPELAANQIDAALWARALQHWEAFESDPHDSPRLRELGIDVYAPRDNLANIEARVSGRRPSRSEASDVLRQLDRVLLRYPERIVHAAQLAHVVVLCAMVKDGAKAAAFVLPALGTLLVDACNFQPEIVHHEFFHLVDYRLHGGDAQPAWDALNPPGTRYAGLEAYAKDPREHGAPPQHFVSRYAQAAAEEDRAETFRVLMGDPQLAAAKRAADPVIDAKARYLIAALDALAEGSSVALGLAAGRAR
jgi:hypothetical protein